MNDTDADTPQLEHGFVQLSYEVFMAICIELGETRGAILAQVVRDQYGAKKMPAGKVDRRLVERAGQVTPGGVREGIRRLVADGVLARDGTGFRFVKDYRRWKTLNDAQRQEIRSQRHAHVTASHPCDATPPERHTHVTPASHPCDGASHPCDALPIKRLKSLDTPPHQAGACAREGEPDPAETRELIDYADRVSGGSWGYSAGTALRAGARPDHLREAMRRASERGQPRWGYVMGIVRSFEANGIDQPLPAKQPAWKAIGDRQDAIIAQFQANMAAKARGGTA